MKRKYAQCRFLIKVRFNSPYFNQLKWLFWKLNFPIYYFCSNSYLFWFDSTCKFVLKFDRVREPVLFSIGFISIIEKINTNTNTNNTNMNFILKKPQFVVEKSNSFCNNFNAHGKNIIHELWIMAHSLALGLKIEQNTIVNEKQPTRCGW